MAEEKSDFDKVQELLQQQVDEYMAQKYPNAGTPQYYPQPTYVDPAQQQMEQINSTIRGAVAGDLNDARFTAADTRDYVNFYSSENENARLYKDRVEETFRLLSRAGRPTDRESILKYIVGDELDRDPDGFMSKLQERKRAQIERASGAMDIGASGMTKEKADKFKGFDKLTSDEMADLMEGMTF